MRFPEFECLDTRSCFHHFIAAILQNGLSHIPKQRFVFHHQDGFFATFKLSLWSTALLRGRKGFRAGREINGERAASVRLTCYINPAFVLLDYPIDGCKSKPCSFADFFGCKKRFKDAAHGTGVHSDSGIFDRKTKERTRARL